MNLSFPFETITTESNRAAVMGRVLDFFDSDTPVPQVVVMILDNDDGPLVYSETDNWGTGVETGYNGGTYRYAGAGTVKTATWVWTAPFAGTGEVFVQYRANANNVTNAVYQIQTQQGIQLASADLTTNSFVWVSLGTFDFGPGSSTITLDAHASTGGYIVVADAVRVVLVESQENADFDQDSDVDLSDLMRWQRGYGNGTTLAEGDANGDATVDGQDLAVWKSQFGTAAVAAPAAVSVAAVEADWTAAAQALLGLAQAEGGDTHLIEDESEQSETGYFESSQYDSSATEAASALSIDRAGSVSDLATDGDAISAVDDFYEQLDSLAPASRWAW